MENINIKTFFPDASFAPLDVTTWDNLNPKETFDEQLEKIKKKKNDRNKEAFRKVYENCRNKILLATTYNIDEFLYEIPIYYSGYPNYNASMCQKYICKKLEKKKINYTLQEYNVYIILSE